MGASLPSDDEEDRETRADREATVAASSAARNHLAQGSALAVLARPLLVVVARAPTADAGRSSVGGAPSFGLAARLADRGVDGVARLAMVKVVAQKPS